MNRTKVRRMSDSALLTQQFAKSNSERRIQFVVEECGTNAKIGAHGERETPVPIPNTAVKPLSGYNTWPIKAWENSTVPNYKRDLLTGVFFYSSACYFPDAENAGVPAEPVRWGFVTFALSELEEHETN
jgi:hypothetical protein